MIPGAGDGTEAVPAGPAPGAVPMQREGPYNRTVSDATNPAILWRFSRDRSTAHATIFPGDGQTTLTWFFDGVMDRAENYESVEMALARAEQIRGILLRDGWSELP